MSIFLLSFCSCKYNVFDLQETEKLTIFCPEFPECLSIFPVFEWKIEIISENKCDVFYSSEKYVELEFEKNKPASVCITPLMLNSDNQKVIFFKPAGFVYPYEKEATWEGGFCAWIFQTLYKSKNETEISTQQIIQFLSEYNWKKLLEALYNEQAKDQMYNPWKIEVKNLLDSISGRNFKSSLLKQKNVYSIPIDKLELNKFGIEKIYSSYIPENEPCLDNKTINLKKNEMTNYMINNDFSLLITYNSSKNIFKEVVYMPINNEAYEQN